jgi:ABC-type bacteriocin/lantibiotic exporter with double-glycine peptidase domain
MSYTHTYATMEVSASVFDEIMQKLRAAGYDDQVQLHPNGIENVLDMHGIGLVRGRGGR